MKKKIFTLTVAILVLAFSLLSFSACTTFDHVLEKVSETIDDVIAFDDAGTSMYDGKTYDMPKALKFYASSPNTSKTVRLTATIEPASATDKSVDWSVSFVNPSSTWATGKTATDYVTVTPTSNGATTADVHFVANFGEQILVTVTSRVSGSANASCTVDCIQDPTPSSFRFSGSGTSYSFGENIPFDFPQLSFFETFSLDNCDQSGTFVVSFPLSTYTLPLTCTAVHMYVTLSDNCKTALTSAISSYNSGIQQYNLEHETQKVRLSSVRSGEQEILASSYNGGGASVSLADFYSVFFNGNLSSPVYQPHLSLIYNSLISGLQNTSGAHFTFKIVCSYAECGSVTTEIPVTFSQASLGFVATSISMNQNAITC